MKKLIFTLMFLAIAATAFAEPAFTWDANPVEQHVDLYQVAIDGVIVADIQPNMWVMVDIPDGNHVATVRAHNAKGWSDFSKGLTFDWPYLFDVPTAPTGEKIIDFTPPQ